MTTITFKQHTLTRNGLRLEQPTMFTFKVFNVRGGVVQMWYVRGQCTWTGVAVRYHG